MFQIIGRKDHRKRKLYQITFNRYGKRTFKTDYIYPSWANLRNEMGKHRFIVNLLR